MIFLVHENDIWLESEKLKVVVDITSDRYCFSGLAGGVVAAMRNLNCLQRKWKHLFFSPG
jgi:hypothetical protein